MAPPNPPTYPSHDPPRKNSLASKHRSESTMTPNLDIFLLTFNCAKNLINAPVFATHLQAALTQNASSLPDLVVL
jgi:hypothetical protein